MRILFLGEIVGKGGIHTLRKMLPALREERKIDLVIGNGNGATGGFGIGRNHSISLNKLGVDVITTGECVYYKKDMVGHIWKAPYMLRAANYPSGNPGKGWGIFTAGHEKVAVLNFMGLSGYHRIHLNNPFTYVTEVIKRVKEKTPYIIVNFHAATTAEKQTMAFHLDGKVSACIGTGQKCLTSDGRIMTDGSFAITDAGRTGSSFSVGGLDQKIEIEKFLTQVPLRSSDSMDELELQGVYLEMEEGSGKVRDYEVLRLPCKELTDERDRSNNGG